MTKPNSRRGSSSDGCFLRTQAESAHRVFVRPKEVCTLCTFLCMAAFRPAFGPFRLVLPTPLHEFLCFRRHGFSAQTVGSVGRSCQRERLEGTCGWRTIRPQSGGVWDPDFLRGNSKWLVAARSAAISSRSTHIGTTSHARGKGSNLLSSTNWPGEEGVDETVRSVSDGPRPHSRIPEA
jgi:hypothetical protein